LSKTLPPVAKSLRFIANALRTEQQTTRQLCDETIENDIT
jgi:hypothetical protein